MIKSCDHWNCDRSPRNPTGAYCDAHYSRKRKGLDMDAPIRKHDAGTWSPWGIQKGYVMRWRSWRGKTEIQFQHRLVMEESIGRPLYPGENVHHINGDRADNRIENLELWNRHQPTGVRVADKLEFYVSELEKHLPEVGSADLFERLRVLVS